MARSAVSLLAGATLVSLSCAVAPVAPPRPAPAAPPPVAAAPAASEDSEVCEVERLLLRRARGLARFEVAELARTLVAEARRRQLEPSLVLAVMHVESRYDPYALSSAGALGLMQILPSTGRELAAREGVPWHGPQTLFDPIANVRLGIAYLEFLASRYEDLSTALAAYNWGPGHIDRRLRRGHALPTVYPGLVQAAYSARRGRS